MYSSCGLHAGSRSDFRFTALRSTPSSRIAAHSNRPMLPRQRWVCMTATEASPTAEATRFTDPWRTVHAFDGRVPRVIDCFARLSPPSSYHFCFWTIALREPRERQPRGAPRRPGTGSCEYPGCFRRVGVTQPESKQWLRDPGSPAGTRRLPSGPAGNAFSSGSTPPRRRSTHRCGRCASGIRARPRRPGTDRCPS